MTIGTLDAIATGTFVAYYLWKRWNEREGEDWIDGVPEPKEEVVERPTYSARHHIALRQESDAAIRMASMDMGMETRRVTEYLWVMRGGYWIRVANPKWYGLAR